MKVTRVGGRISRDRLPPGGQANHGWLAPRGATCPGGKINWDTGNSVNLVTGIIHLPSGCEFCLHRRPLIGSIYPLIWEGTLRYQFLRYRELMINTVKTLNIGTPRLTTVVVLNIKQFNFTMK